MLTVNVDDRTRTLATAKQAEYRAKAEVGGVDEKNILDALKQSYAVKVKELEEAEVCCHCCGPSARTSKTTEQHKKSQAKGGSRSRMVRRFALGSDGDRCFQGAQSPQRLDMSALPRLSCRHESFEGARSSVQSLPMKCPVRATPHSMAIPVSSPCEPTAPLTSRPTRLLLILNWWR